jgi:carboxymethylenebutenolidase
MPTPEQQKIIDLWDEHTCCEFELKDSDATMATMTDNPYMHNIPTMVCGNGADEVKHFYKTSFIFNLPEDTETVLISRTVDAHQLVDEIIFKFTHTVEMPWMLPGVAPTGKRVEVPLVVILGVKDGKVAHEHIHWDQASVLAQVGLIDPTNLPIAGIASAKKMEERIR